MVQNSDISSIDQNVDENTDFIQLKSDNDGNIDIPAGHFIGDAGISRDGQDLVLEFAEDSSFVVENYFSDQSDYLIQDSSGSVLTSGLVNSFAQSSPEYAQNASMNDESPIGAVEELKGEATVIRVDGSTENVTLGTPIYEGDVIQTSNDGAVNLMFMDETSMAISENARIAIDNYKFDATTESGETNLSVLRGVFVYTSGLIGRDDPDDVEINTPVGSIGIRGTIIAGHINPEGQSEISVLEGAIVIKNGAGERTLSQQYETVKLSSFQDAMEYKGVEAANDIGKTYGSVRDVLPKLFSSINDAADEEVKAQEAEEEVQEEIEALEEQAEEAQEEQNAEEQKMEPDPALEIIQNDSGFGVEGEGGMKNDLTTSGDLKGSHHRGPHPRGGFQQRGDREEILYQEAIAGEVDGEPQIFHNFKPLFEHTEAGTVIGTIVMRNYPIGTTIEFTSGGTTSGSGNYDLTQIANTNIYQVSLNNTVGAATPGTAIFFEESINIDIIHPDTTVEPYFSHTPEILDAAVNLNAPGGYNYEITNVGNAIPPIKIGDFNGDGNNNDLANINGTGNVIVNGVDITTSDTNIYSSLDSVGDINNDGFADIIVGSPSNSGSKGDAFIIEGTNATPVPNNIGLAGSAGDEEGASVAGIGDFDGDGKSDYAIGSPGFTASAADDGQVILHLSASVPHDIDGAVANQKFGGHIAGIADINGDGLSDVLFANQSGSTIANEAYIAYGNAGAVPNVTSSMTKITAAHDIVAGGSAGDFNGDGYDDFAVSLNDGTNINTYIVYGEATPFTTITMAYLENPDFALKIHHAGAGGAADYNISSVGDFDGDGFDDIQVGVVGGNQFVVHGDIGGNNVPYVVDGTATDSMSGLGGPDGVVGASANGQSLVGDVNFNDNDHDNLSMKGGGSNNNFNITDNAFRNIDGGEEFDTIKFMGSGNLNFGNKNFEDISQIEEIKFGGAGQTITLTSENIFNMLKSSDNGELRISGTGGVEFDVINPGATNNAVLMLEEGGTGTANNSGTTSIGGEAYNTYEVGGYSLYIDTNITTTFV